MKIKIVLISLLVISIPLFTQAASNGAASRKLDELEGKEAKEVVRFKEEAEGGLHAIGFFTGYLDEELRYEKDHRGAPFLVSLGYDARPFFSKIGINTKGRLDWVLEPFLNIITSPTTDIEVGSNFLLEYDFPLTDWLKPYIKGGLGLVYMTQHVEEQATQWNFLPQGSVGFHLKLKENIALSCEYRHRHLSNASIKSPNKGIDAKLYLAGLTFFFE